MLLLKTVKVRTHLLRMCMESTLAQNPATANTHSATPSIQNVWKLMFLRSASSKSTQFGEEVSFSIFLFVALNHYFFTRLAIVTALTGKSLWHYHREYVNLYNIPSMRCCNFTYERQVCGCVRHRLKFIKCLSRSVGNYWHISIYCTVLNTVQYTRWIINATFSGAKFNYTLNW